MFEPSPLEALRFAAEILAQLGITKIFVMSSAIAIFLMVARMIVHDPNTVSGEQARQIQITAICSTVNIDTSDDAEDDDEWEPEPTPAPAQPFTACPKCGAPRTSHTCEYCKQTLF